CPVGGTLADDRIRLANLVGVLGLHLLGQQRGGNADGAGGIGDVDHGVVLVVRVNLHCRVRLGGGRATDHQRQVEVLALHFPGDVDHLVQGGGDQSGQADDVALLFNGGLEDLVRLHHHAQVDNVVAVAPEHHGDDVLADIVHVALYRGHENLALGFRLVAL